MLEFENIKLSDREWVDKLMAISDLRATEYCFTSMYIWAPAYSVQLASYKDFLILKSKCGTDTGYSFSTGKGRVEEIMELVELLRADAGEGELQLNGLLDEHVDLLSRAYGDRFVYEEVRDSFDYVYESDRLIGLSGKKLQAKRNLISRFSREYPDWTYEEVTSANIMECQEMAREWCLNYGCGQDSSLSAESMANSRAMTEMEALHLDGGMLRVGGRVIAYTLGEKLNSDTYIVHIEKAFPEYTGAYQVINREFAARHAADATYINREDDAGDEGLRKAKLSYQPAMLLKKYIATIK